MILNIESSSIRKKVMQLLQSSFSFAYKKHYIDFNPSLAAVATAKRTKPVTTKKREVFWSVDQIKFVLKTCKQNYNELFLPLLLSLMLGTRISETIALKYADVDFSNKSILIMRQLGSYIDHKTNEKVKGEILPKTDNGVREIPVPDWVLEEIIVARGCYEKNKLRIPGFEDHDYICCKINGKPYHRRSLSHDFNQLMNMCGIHNIHWHDLRHIYASTLKNNEINIKAVSTYMGHGNSVFTEKVYVSNVEKAYDCTILERVWTFVKPIEKIEENVTLIPLQNVAEALLT